METSDDKRIWRKRNTLFGNMNKFSLRSNIFHFKCFEAALINFCNLDQRIPISINTFLFYSISRI